MSKEEHFPAETIIEWLNKCGNGNAGGYACEECPFSHIGDSCYAVLMRTAAKRLKLAVGVVETLVELSKVDSKEITRLKALEENNASAIDTNERLADELQRVNARLRYYENVANDYGVSLDVMLELAKSQIKTVSDNCKLSHTIEDMEEEMESMKCEYLELKTKSDKLQRAFRTALARIEQLQG